MSFKMQSLRSINTDYPSKILSKYRDEAKGRIPDKNNPTLQECDTKLNTIDIFIGLSVEYIRYRSTLN